MAVAAAVASYVRRRPARRIASSLERAGRNWVIIRRGGGGRLVYWLLVAARRGGVAMRDARANRLRRLRPPTHVDDGGVYLCVCV